MEHVGDGGVDIVEEAGLVAGSGSACSVRLERRTGGDVFNSVVIATDIDAGSDRAIPVGTELARRGRLPVEVLTVVSEPSAPVDDTRRRRAQADGAALRVVHGDDIADGDRRPGTGS